MKKLMLKKLCIRLCLVFIVCIGFILFKKVSLNFLIAYPLFIMGIFFLAIAWMDYLNFDGVEIEKMSFIRYASNIMNKVGLDHIAKNNTSTIGVSDELACLYSNLFVGIILIIPSIITTII